MKRIVLGIFMLFMILAVSWTVMALPDSTSTQTGRSMNMGFQQNGESPEQTVTEETERIGYIMINGKEDSLPVIEGNVYRDNSTMTGVVTMGNFNVKISQKID